LSNNTTWPSTCAARRSPNARRLHGPPAECARSEQCEFVVPGEHPPVDRAARVVGRSADEDIPAINDGRSRPTSERDGIEERGQRAVVHACVEELAGKISLTANA